MKTHSIDSVQFSRARDFYLYTADGKRYVDMHLNDAFAVFGHKPKNLGSLIKQVLDRGLVANLAQKWNARCNKAIKTCFDGYQLIGWYYMLNPENDSLPSLQKNEKTFHLVRPYCDAPPKDKKTHKKTAPILYAIPNPWSPKLVALLQPSTLAQPTSTPDVCIGLDAITDTTYTLYKTAKISSLHAVSFYHSLNILIKNGTTHRPLPAHTKNRKDIFRLHTNECDSQTTRAPWRKRPHKQTPHIDIPLPSHWKQDGIYIVPPKMSETKFNQMREVFFSHGFFVNTQRFPWLIPPYFTKQELENWNLAHAALEAIS